MASQILFVAFVVDDRDVSVTRSKLGLVSSDVSPCELYDLGSSPFVNPAEMYARFGSVRKISARKFKDGQVTFDFV